MCAVGLCTTCGAPTPRTTSLLLLLLSLPLLLGFCDTCGAPTLLLLLLPSCSRPRKLVWVLGRLEDRRSGEENDEEEEENDEEEEQDDEEEELEVMVVVVVVVVDDRTFQPS